MYRGASVFGNRTESFKKNICPIFCCSTEWSTFVHNIRKKVWVSFARNVNSLSIFSSSSYLQCTVVTMFDPLLALVWYEVRPNPALESAGRPHRVSLNAFLQN